MKIITNMEELKITLESKGLKPTFQRLKILEYLTEHKNHHPTAENIYEVLEHSIPTLSITTIYNALGAFLEKGIISAETITGTEVRYDVVTKPHHHFLCKQCGRIIDIDIECPVFESKSVQGHYVDEVHGYFKGICAECLKKQQKKENQNQEEK
jgi:Fe2+ or Zn2+ uptake regulation protein